jgi:hypothetical protein
MRFFTAKATSFSVLCAVKVPAIPRNHCKIEQKVELLRGHDRGGGLLTLACSGLRRSLKNMRALRANASKAFPHRFVKAGGEMVALEVRDDIEAGRAGEAISVGV